MIEDTSTERRTKMDYAAILSKLLAIMRQKKHPILHLDEVEKGGNGILRLLWINEINKGETMSPGELSAIQDISTGRIATTLKTLETKNYIRREIDLNDRRRVEVILTDQGREVSKKLFHEAKTDAENIFKKIGDEDANEFIRILNKLIEAYQN